MNSNRNTLPTNSDPFDNMSDEEFDKINAMDKTELAAYLKNKQIQQNAHIVNGGEEMFPCPACKGTGRWGWTNRRCFKCNATGKVSRSKLAAHKGKITQQIHYNTWCQENRDLIDRMSAHLWHRFVKSMYDQIHTDLKPLSPNQLSAVTDAVNRLDMQAAQKAEQQQADRDRKSGDIDLTAIQKLFDTAKSHGLKKPVWRAKGMSIHTARQYGDDTLWVAEERAIDFNDPNTDPYETAETERVYVGKIVNGHFQAFRKATDETFPLLQSIAANPLQAAINYGQATNRCSCCGRKLTQGVSVVAGIGPICSEKWGLNEYREYAATEVAAERALYKK